MALVIKIKEDTSGTGIKVVVPKNRIVERVFISKILAYSARKNKAKWPAAYSMLKPETSSDSPSVRSKGARLVSASVEMYHIKVKGQAGRRSHVVS